MSLQFQLLNLDLQWWSYSALLAGVVLELYLMGKSLRLILLIALGSLILSLFAAIKIDFGAATTTFIIILSLANIFLESSEGRLNEGRAFLINIVYVYVFFELLKLWLGPALWFLPLLLFSVPIFWSAFSKKEASRNTAFFISSWTSLVLAGFAVLQYNGLSSLHERYESTNPTFSGVVVHVLFGMSFIYIAQNIHFASQLLAFKAHNYHRRRKEIEEAFVQDFSKEQIDPRLAFVLLICVGIPLLINYFWQLVPAAVATSVALAAAPLLSLQVAKILSPMPSQISGNSE